MERLGRIAAAGGLLLVLVAAGPAFAAPPVQEARPVKVERVKPEKPKLPTLRFLRENRDFLRARMDALLQVMLETEARTVPMDERYLGFAAMRAELDAARDTLAFTRGEAERREFLASVNELGDLEGELDLLDSLLAEQELRIRSLEEDFLGRQETALIVLVRGGAEGYPPSSLALTDEAGETVRAPLTDPDRVSLAGGGILQVYHEFVEPREATWELVLTGVDGRALHPVYLTMEPERDQLNFLELDLTGLTATGEDPAGIEARAWVQRRVSPPPGPEGSALQ
jgi:hypothetical protein